MVARSPPKQREMAVVAARPLNPILLRDTVKKVDKCMARLQELQHTVAGGRKVISGVRIKNANTRRSPPGKLPMNTEEWRRMSLPAMLLGETVGEILQASQFAKNIVGTLSSKTSKRTIHYPRTPLTERRKQEQAVEHPELHARRKREKQVALQTIRSESDMPSVQRAKSRIDFETSPVEKRDREKENCRYIANRISPRKRPWAKKAVLFPNPLFHSSPTSQHPKFSKTKSPMIAKNGEIPHKFLIKSPPSASKFQVKIKSHPLSISPTRAATASSVKKSPEASTAAKLSRSFSPSRLANRLVSPLKNTNYVQKNGGASAAAKLRRSFSPSRMANRLASPLKSRKCVQKSGAVNIVCGLKQRPTSMSVQLSPRRT